MNTWDVPDEVHAAFSAMLEEAQKDSRRLDLLAENIGLDGKRMREGLDASFGRCATPAASTAVAAGVELRAAAEEALEYIDGIYDGAPDSTTRHLGGLLERLKTALSK